MIKLLAIAATAIALTACSSTPPNTAAMGASPATQNSPDVQAAMQGNAAAASPGGGGSGVGGAAPSGDAPQ